jgi:hypothetical protein
MPTTPATANTLRANVDEQFFDLICSDPDLLQVEFDAIIAAEWPGPPATRPGRGAAREQPIPQPAHRAAARTGSPVTRPRRPGIGGWARQRSPPHDRHDT